MRDTDTAVQRLARLFVVTPRMAAVIAFALLCAAFLLAVQNDRIGRAEKLRQTTVQAEILASSIAAPLAFDDHAAAQEYLNALRANPEVKAAGVYDNQGRLVAGFQLPYIKLPSSARLARPSVIGSDLVVTTKVIQAGTVMGSVYLRTSILSWPHRAVRYLGIALVVLMASLLIAVFGTSYASLREAHARLQAEINQREKAEEALRQSQKMEAMGQLTGGVAHDFNNMLMVASSGLDLMERTTDPVRIEKLKNSIRQAIDRGAKLTQQLLTFARRSPMHPEVVDLAERIRGMDALLDRSLGESMNVGLQLPPNLWPIEVDPSQLEVALLNIALNARDAMPDGGTLTISAENIMGRDGVPDQVRIDISDTGIGIPREMFAKIFEPFFTTKDVGQGTGLGLSQVYGFARASGGEVRVDSQVGIGTTMSLFIPRSSKAPSAGEAARPKAAAAVQQGLVLLVEDDAEVGSMIADMLGELGYGVERAMSAEEAISKLDQGNHYMLLLSDMVMPGKRNGLDLVREVGRRWPKLPAMLMTGYSAAAASASRENIRLLLKPYTLEDLAQQVQAALGQATH